MTFWMIADIQAAVTSSAPLWSIQQLHSVIVTGRLLFKLWWLDAFTACCLHAIVYCGLCLKANVSSCEMMAGIKRIQSCITKIAWLIIQATHVWKSRWRAESWLLHGVLVGAIATWQQTLMPQESPSEGGVSHALRGGTGRLRGSRWWKCS